MQNKISSPGEIMKFICELENRFSPQIWAWEDIDIWPVIRANLYYELSIQALESEWAGDSRFTKMKRVLRGLLSIKSPKYSQNDILLVSDGISYVNQDGRLYEKFCDPVIEILNEENRSWLKWNLAGELDGQWVHIPQKVNRYLDGVLIRSKFAPQKAFNNYLKISLTHFCEYLYIQAGFDWNVTSLERKLSGISRLVKWFKHQLEAIRPKMVLIVSYYSDRGMALIKACNDLGIHTADIQHGMQGTYHAAYAGWNKISSRGYNTIPKSFLVWSDNEAFVIDQWAQKTGHRAIVIGNLFEKKWFSGNSVVQEVDVCIERVLGSLRAGSTALLTLQYGIEYGDKFWEFIRVSQKKFNWLIRLHPVMNTPGEKKRIIDKLDAQGIENYELDNVSRFPLYGLLRHVNIHVTHSSSTVIEARNFGVNSIVVDPFGAELFETEIELGYVAFGAEIDELLESMQRLSVHKFTERQSIRSASSQGEITEFLDSIL